MARTQKLMIAAVATVMLALLAPTVFTVLTARGTSGYFHDGRCMCGHECFIRIEGDGYFQYSPGHGMPEQRVFALRSHNGEWEMLALRPRDDAWSPVEEGKVVARLRFQGGALYKSWSGTTNWTRHARVYNKWPIWLAELRSESAIRISCVSNLKQIGLAFREWSLDNDDRFPCNVSTNAGGAMEFSAVGRDGFDRNAARHFQVLSNELNTPKILVCPEDKARKPAADFVNLQAGNVTYQLRSGTNVSEANPREVLAVCPVDGNILYCDGTVKEAKK